jgi:hypothetical protein
MLSQKDMIRFDKYVDTEGECYLWTGAVTGSGYGLFSIQGIAFSAHRIAYEVYHGPISSGVHILHTCNNKLCVRDEHLYAGTEQDNSRDRVSTGNHGTQKLSVGQVQLIKSLLLRKLVSQKILVQLFGISNQTVSSIHTKATWAWVDPLDISEEDLLSELKTLLSR